MQPSKEAATAADEIVLNLRRDKKAKTSGSGRNAVLRAALAHEPTATLQTLLNASDKTLVKYFVAVLADAWCLGDPKECLSGYDMSGWNARKSDMPHVEQVRNWIGATLEDRRDADVAADPVE